MDGWGAVFCIGVGIVWRMVSILPSAHSVRQRVSSLVFYVLLPALSFRAMATAPLGNALWQVPVIATTSILSAGVIALLLFQCSSYTPTTRAALLLASAWGNVTYLGIPVLTTVVGSGSVYVAVLFDFAAATPLLWTVGVATALHARGNSSQPAWRRHFLSVIPLWAALAGLALRLSNQPLPPPIDYACAIASSAVIPLMMFVLGLSLRWEYLRLWQELVPVAAIKLLAAPAVALLVALAIGIHGSLLQAVVLEAAMPTMMLTLVVSQMFELDTERIAAAIVLTTLAAVVTLPLWWWLLSMLG